MIVIVLMVLWLEEEFKNVEIVVKFFFNDKFFRNWVDGIFEVV